MKKLIYTLLALAMCVSIAACGSDEPVETTKSEEAQTAATTTTKADTTTAKPAVTECAHDYQVSENKDATCTEKGSKTYTCSKCGDSYSEEIEMLAHAFTDATCTVPKTCSVCGAIEGDALDHQFGGATCTEPAICTVCQATQGEALGHQYEIIESVSATCKADGSATYTCERCEDSITEVQKWFGHSNGAYCEGCGSIYYNMQYYRDPDSPSGSAAIFHDNGAIDYGFIVNKSFVWDEDSLTTYDGDECYVMSEAEMVKQIKSKFVFSDSEIETLKAASPYTELIFYADGNFYCRYSGFGDIASYSHNPIGYTKQTGAITVYFDYVSLTYDDSYHIIDEEHLYYYAIEYQYTGTSDLNITRDQIELKSGTPNDSIRMAAAYKVDSLPASTTMFATQE